MDADEVQFDPTPAEANPTPAEAAQKEEPPAPTMAPQGAWGKTGVAVAATVGVKVHPIVVFSILDHFTRRQEGQDRVIGTLLGTRTGNIVEVTNCFAVPHTEKEGEVAVGQATNKSMYGLLSKINNREVIVGWYATTSGLKLDESSTLIHDFYVQECEHPIHLTVDTCLDTDRGVKVDAYVASKLLVEPDQSLPLADYVRPLDVELCFSEPELLCIEKMIHNQPDPFSSPESIAPLSGYNDGSTDEVEPLRESLENISDLLETCLDYCADIQSGKRKPNPDTTRYILNALDALPRLDPSDLDQAFNAHTQDIMMVSYLANITKSQLAIASKIHSTF